MMTRFSTEELQQALRALASLTGKCEKAQEKLKEPSSQFTLMQHRVDSLRIACSLITDQLEAWESAE
ncbi:hypothetical protein [Sphaerochaeta sp. PS]|uniref:hypothetical protein n=1 Tax=Sphaerochaeta sp. PS TaxID=3076336 RepID=UPI0028A326A4|nr:hypothetical protein [Sphaerochaeta sp. PS]MDT4761885.1 hypothetical protein [Sphaerochaeta sp. PS]